MDALSTSVQILSLVWVAPMPMTPRERLDIFFQRLFALPTARTAEEAREQIRLTLVEVEDEHSGIPNQPDRLGRMYPPLDDNRHQVTGYPDVTRFRTKGHNIFLRINGAIEIRSAGKAEPREGVLCFAKQGGDGRGVWEP